MRLPLKRFAAVFAAAAIFMCQAPAYAAELEQLTVDQAVSFAISSSNELKNLDVSLVSTQESLDSAKEQYYETYDYATKIRLANQIMEIEAQMVKSGKNTDVAKEKLEISVINLFASIISAQKSLELQDKSLEITKKELKIAKLKSEMGYLAKADYESQVNAYDQKVKNRQTQEIAITNAFINLNKTIGRSLDRVYDLELSAAYEPLQRTSLQANIEYAINTSAELEGLKSDIEVAKTKLERHDSLVSTESKESLERALEQAERSLYESERSLTQKVMTTYNSIQNQEIQHEVELMKLSALTSQLSLKQTQADLGKITQLSLESFLYQIDQQIESIRSLEISHYVNVLQLTKPGVI